MLKKPVSFVLVSLKVSTYQPGTTPVPTDVGWQGENPYASSGRLWALTGHGPLTISRAFTNVALFIHRVVRLIILRVADLTAASLNGPLNIPETTTARSWIILNFPRSRQASAGPTVHCATGLARLSHGPVPKSNDLTWIAADDNAFTYESCRGQQ